MVEENRGPEEKTEGEAAGGISRRNFIKIGVVGGAVLTAGYGAYRHLGGYQDAVGEFKIITDKEYKIIQSISEVFFPAGAAGSPATSSVTTGGSGSGLGAGGVGSGVPSPRTPTALQALPVLSMSDGSPRSAAACRVAARAPAKLV